MLGSGSSLAFAADAPAQPASFPIPALSDSFKQSSLSNVIVIGTGGTLAGKAEDSTSFQNYKAGTFNSIVQVGWTISTDDVPWPHCAGYDDWLFAANSQIKEVGNLFHGIGSSTQG